MNIQKHNLEIISNAEVAENWYQMELSTTDIQRWAPAPGQFISVSFPHLTFRRPFAVSEYKAHQSCSILYQVCNRIFTPAIHNDMQENASTAMANLTQDQTIEVMGFHGNSFPIPPAETQPILVAGGIGLGPLIYFSHHLLLQSEHTPILIVGGKHAGAIPTSLLDASDRLTVKIATDDGSLGVKGTSIDLLEREISERAQIYLCGPVAMMRAGAELAQRHMLPAWVSMDTMMACVMGACVACVVPLYTDDTFHSSHAEKDKSRHIEWAKTCIEGSVFESNAIAWEQMSVY